MLELSRMRTQPDYQALLSRAFHTGLLNQMGQHSWLGDQTVLSFAAWRWPEEWAGLHTELGCEWSTPPRRPRLHVPCLTYVCSRRAADWQMCVDWYSKYEYSRLGLLHTQDSALRDNTCPRPPALLHFNVGKVKGAGTELLEHTATAVSSANCSLARDHLVELLSTHLEPGSEARKSCDAASWLLPEARACNASFLLQSYRPSGPMCCACSGPESSAL